MSDQSDDTTEEPPKGEPTGEMIDTTPVVNYSATDRVGYEVQADLTITLPVKDDGSSPFIKLMHVLSAVSRVQGVELDGYDERRLTGEDAPETGCPIPNLPDPTEDPDGFCEAIDALQAAVDSAEGHNPFENIGVVSWGESDTGPATNE